MRPSIAFWPAVGGVLMVLVLAASVLPVYLKPETEHDFQTYYAAAQAFNHGQDPYQTADLSKAINGTVRLPFVYPPAVLYVFKPFTGFDFPTAARIFLSLKLAALGGLLFLWHRLFNLNRCGGLLWILIPLLFNGALLVDLRFGNISVFEQLLLWAGFHAYTRGRPGWCGAAILLASSFKLAPVLLLGLFLVRWKKNEVALAVLLGGIFLASLAAEFVLWPDLFKEFFHTMQGVGGERGENNPASWALLGDLAHWVRISAGLSVPPIIPRLSYAILVAGLLATASVLFPRLESLAQNRADLWRICLTCILYALIAPHFKDYSYVLLIAPAIFVVSSSQWLNAVLPIFALLAISSHRNFQVLGRTLEPFYRFQGEYYCLILAGLLLVLAGCAIWKESSPPPATVAPI